MGSHTARYGAVCAMWYEVTGDPYYKEQANRFLNVATYMTYSDGYVAVGLNWPGAWFSDGYSDYVRHFMDAIAAVPEWAPEGENHLLSSTSVVTSIRYEKQKIEFSTFDESSQVIMRLNSKPVKVLLNGKPASVNSWKWEPLKKGGVLRLN